MVEHGQTGLLAAKGDEEELSNHLIYLLKNSEEAVCMGRNGQERVARFFSKDKSSLDFLNLLETLYKP